MTRNKTRKDLDLLNDSIHQTLMDFEKVERDTVHGGVNQSLKDAIGMIEKAIDHLAEADSQWTEVELESETCQGLALNLAKIERARKR